jgi:hypothetical protein
MMKLVLTKTGTIHKIYIIMIPFVKLLCYRHQVTRPSLTAGVLLTSIAYRARIVLFNIHLIKGGEPLASFSEQASLCNNGNYPVRP